MSGKWVDDSKFHSCCQIANIMFTHCTLFASRQSIAKKKRKNLFFFCSMSSFSFIFFSLGRFYSMCWIDTGTFWGSVNGIFKWIITEWIRSSGLFCLFRIDGYIGYLDVFRRLSSWWPPKCVQIFSKRFNHVTLHCTNHRLSRLTQSKFLITL